MFVLPYNKDNAVRKKPWVVFALIFINGVVLSLEYVDTPTAWFAAHGFIGALHQGRTLFVTTHIHSACVFTYHSCRDHRIVALLDPPPRT